MYVILVMITRTDDFRLSVAIQVAGDDPRSAELGIELNGPPRFQQRGIAVRRVLAADIVQSRLGAGFRSSDHEVDQLLTAKEPRPVVVALPACDGQLHEFAAACRPIAAHELRGMCLQRNHFVLVAVDQEYRDLGLCQYADVIDRVVFGKSSRQFLGTHAIGGSRPLDTRPMGHVEHGVDARQRSHPVWIADSPAAVPQATTTAAQQATFAGEAAVLDQFVVQRVIGRLARGLPYASPTSMPATAMPASRNRSCIHFSCSSGSPGSVGAYRTQG